jgi:hypothetical protein
VDPSSRSKGLDRWIKSDCGRAKVRELARRPGLPARLRLGWFVLIGALRDWRLPDPEADRALHDPSSTGGS